MADWTQANLCRHLIFLFIATLKAVFGDFEKSLRNKTNE